MNDVQPLDRQTAETYAAWFKALADGTRVQIVSLLARSGRPLTVREIVAAVQVGQTVTDCDPDEFEAACFGPAGYPDASGLPDGAVRASLGCGNPVAVA